MITYILSLALTVIFFIVGLTALIKRRRQRKKQLAIARTYDQLVREYKLTIEYSEFLFYRYIGLDRRNRKLLLIDHCNGERQELCVPLFEIRDSKIIQVMDDRQGIKAILLELRYKRSNKAVRFCFYDKKRDPGAELLSLSRKATRWKSRVDIFKHPGSISLQGEYVL
jgi:hypothetical protein